MWIEFVWWRNLSNNKSLKKIHEQAVYIDLRICKCILMLHSHFKMVMRWWLKLYQLSLRIYCSVNKYAILVYFVYLKIGCHYSVCLVVCETFSVSINVKMHKINHPTKISWMQWCEWTWTLELDAILLIGCYQHGFCIYVYTVIVRH